jgi:hypothetical protein
MPADLDLADTRPEQTWLDDLRRLADALEQGLPLPDEQDEQDEREKRPKLTLIQGGRDDA